MKLFPATYSSWTPESKRLLAFGLLWFAHGNLLGVHRVFAVTWICHALLAGVWGLAWLWRAGQEARRHYLYRAWARGDAQAGCPVCRLVILWKLSGSYRLKRLHEEWGALPCHVCGADQGERCDAGLHG